MLQVWLCETGQAPDWAPLKSWLEAHRPLIHTAHAMQPGTPVFNCEPVWQVGMDELDSDAVDNLVEAMTPAQRRLETRWATTPLQVYRQMDAEGRLLQDVVAPLHGEPLPGMVLLQPVWLDRRWCAPELDLEQIQRLRTRQSRAMPPGTTELPVLDRTQ